MKDHDFMARAIELAARGRAKSPAKSYGGLCDC